MMISGPRTGFHRRISQQNFYPVLFRTCVEEVSLAYGKDNYDICEFAIREIKLYDRQKEYVLPESAIQHTKLRINPMC